MILVFQLEGPRNPLPAFLETSPFHLQQACLACGSPTLDKKGFGTEQIQEELGQLFPDATVGRMDLDTTRGKYAYEKIISAFENHEMDILVGTQMVTKGPQSPAK